MSSEYEYDFDPCKPLKCLLSRNAGITHPAKSSEKRTWLSQQLGRRLGSAATAFAMIGFSEVCQFEIDRESLRHLMCFCHIQTTNNFLGASYQALHVLKIVSWLRVQLSMLNQQHAQFFNC